MIGSEEEDTSLDEVLECEVENECENGGSCCY